MTYWKSLSTHPGVPIAAGLTVCGALAGMEKDDPLLGAIVGAAIMSVFWVPVLVTAWLHRDEE